MNEDKRPDCRSVVSTCVHARDSVEVHVCPRMCVRANNNEFEGANPETSNCWVFRSRSSGARSPMGCMQPQHPTVCTCAVIRISKRSTCYHRVCWQTCCDSVSDFRKIFDSIANLRPGRGNCPGEMFHMFIMQPSLWLGQVMMYSWAPPEQAWLKETDYTPGYTKSLEGFAIQTTPFGRMLFFLTGKPVCDTVQQAKILEGFCGVRGVSVRKGSLRKVWGGFEEGMRRIWGRFEFYYRLYIFDWLRVNTPGYFLGFLKRWTVNR